MLDFQGFPVCCSLKIVTNILMGTVQDFLAKHKTSQGMYSHLPVVFADNGDRKNYTTTDAATRETYRKNYGIEYTGLGGFKLAEDLRKLGYRVDQIDLGAGNHNTPVYLWVWWPNKTSVEGKKPSRINYVEQREEQKSSTAGGTEPQSKPEKAKSDSPRKPRSTTRKGTELSGFGRVFGLRPVRRLAKRPRTGL